MLDSVGIPTTHHYERYCPACDHFSYKNDSCQTGAVGIVLVRTLLVGLLLIGVVPVPGALHTLRSSNSDDTFAD